MQIWILWIKEAFSKWLTRITTTLNRNKKCNRATSKLEDKRDLNLLYKKIYKIGYSRMIVEVGLTFLNNLIKNKMIHDLYIFKSNKKLGKNGKNNNTSKYLRETYPKLLTINLNGDNLLKKEFK